MHNEMPVLFSQCNVHASQRSDGKHVKEANDSHCHIGILVDIRVSLDGVVHDVFSTHVSCRYEIKCIDIVFLFKCNLVFPPCCRNSSTALELPEVYLEMILLHRSLKERLP